jgi:hypothetical protein
MFDTEYDAFVAYCKTYPTNAVLLVDTYNSLKSGVPDAIRAFNEVLRPMGITKCGIRFDSGDMAYLTRKARAMLDEAGWPDCKITVSNALDERLIRDLLIQGAMIDSFGVGERLITARSEPVFGGVYKLAAVEDPTAPSYPRSRSAKTWARSPTPASKRSTVFTTASPAWPRRTTSACRRDRGRHPSPLICDPDAHWKSKNDDFGRAAAGAYLQARRAGLQAPLPAGYKDYCAKQTATLWPEVQRFDNPHNYYVDLRGGTRLKDGCWEPMQEKTERRISAATSIALCVIVVGLQIALSLLLTSFLQERASIVYGALEFLGAVFAVRIYLRSGSPSYKLSWMCLLLALPVAGMLLFCLWGGTHQAKTLSLKNVPASKPRPGMQDESARCVAHLNRQTPAWGRLAAYLQKAGFLVYDGNTDVRYFG